MPKRFTEFDEEFDKVTTFKSQLQSLKTRHVDMYICDTVEIGHVIDFFVPKEIFLTC